MKNSDLKYHLFITKEGRIEHLLPLEIPGTAVLGLNFNSVHIVYQGGIDKNGIEEDTRNDLQKGAIQRALWYVYNTCEFEDSIEILGRRDVIRSQAICGLLSSEEYGTLNPGFDVKKEYSWEQKP